MGVRGSVNVLVMLFWGVRRQRDPQLWGNLTRRVRRKTSLDRPVRSLPVTFRVVGAPRCAPCDSDVCQASLDFCVVYVGELGLGGLFPIFLCEKNKTYSVLNPLIAKPQIWNLYSEFPLETKDVYVGTCSDTPGRVRGQASLNLTREEDFSAKKTQVKPLPCVKNGNRSRTWAARRKPAAPMLACAFHPSILRGTRCVPEGHRCVCTHTCAYAQDDIIRLGSQAPKELCNFVTLGPPKL